MPGQFNGERKVFSTNSSREWCKGMMLKPHLTPCRKIDSHQCVRACRLSASVVSNFFATPGTVAHQAPRSTGFSRQEYWNGFPPPGDLPNPGIKLPPPASATLARGVFTTQPPGKPTHSGPISKSKSLLIWHQSANCNISKAQKWINWASCKIKSFLACFYPCQRKKKTPSRKQKDSP